MARQMHLAFSAHLTGAHPGAWRHRLTAPGADVDIRAYRALARIAEAGCFDLFFMADVPAFRTDPRGTWSRYPHFTNVLEPLTALSAIAGATDYIGLGGTVSTTFSEPFNVARQFASLDHLSGGRAAWNVVTTANKDAAGNFGMDRLPLHEERYARAREFVKIVDSLWKTWDDEAFVRDQNTGLFLDPDRLRYTDYHSKHFDLHAALNIGRTPQGQPLIIQAGASEAGKELAAETADVVFASADDLESARAFYADLKGRMPKFGRAPDNLKILAGLPVMVAETEQEAHDRFGEIQALISEDIARQRIGVDLETDLWDIPFDEVVPLERIPEKPNLHTHYFAKLAAMARDKRMTLRQIAAAYERGMPTIRGNPRQVADILEEWFLSNAADGFMLILNLQPFDLGNFVRLVVPELQRRELFRTEYSGSTLRDHFGLRWK